MLRRGLALLRHQGRRPTPRLVAPFLPCSRAPFLPPHALSLNRKTTAPLCWRYRRRRSGRTDPPPPSLPFLSSFFVPVACPSPLLDIS
ncbi:hypothetical protein SOVF_207420 [Spinacia oleracea]|nr:hypothetical protein SOVF_207420 [Spinacia oleracea]